MTKQLAARLSTAMLAAVLLASIQVGAQAPPKSKWTAPRTPWGDPDISGAFTNKDQQGIPFERDAALGTRQFLTEQEYAAREETARTRVNREDSVFDAEDPDASPANGVW